MFKKSITISNVVDIIIVIVICVVAYFIARPYWIEYKELTRLYCDVESSPILLAGACQCEKIVYLIINLALIVATALMTFVGRFFKIINVKQTIIISIVMILWLAIILSMDLSTLSKIDGHKAIIIVNQVLGGVLYIAFLITMFIIERKISKA